MQSSLFKYPFSFLLISDLLIMLVCFTFSYTVFYQELPTLIERDPYSLFILYLVFTWIMMALLLPIYQEQRKYPIIKTVTDFIKYVTIFLSFISLSIFIARWNFVSRELLITFMLLYLFCGVSFRIIWRWSSQRMREKGYQVKNLLIIGTGQTAAIIEEKLTTHKEFGYQLVGFLQLNGTPSAIKDESRILGEVNLLKSVVSKYTVDEVVVTSNTVDNSEIRDLISFCDDLGIRSWIVPDFFATVAKSAVLDDLDGIPILKIRPEPLQSPVNRFFKRVLDILIAGFVFLFILPFISLVIYLLNQFFNAGPLFFKQKRHGMENEVFECIKFRTMVNDGQTHTFKQAQKDDPRVTPLGKFLRKTNIDEIPQVINVLMGEMSIVGPRPHPVELNEQWQEEISKYMVRHFVQPGMTGWAQVNGYRGETETKHKMMKRIQYDIWYIENWSFGLDLKIIFLTAFKMISGDRAAY